MIHENLETLLIEELYDLYDAEHQILKHLPKIEKEVSSPHLKEALRNHYKETKEQVKRLHHIFDILDVNYTGKHSAGMAGVLLEGSKFIKRFHKSPIKDCAIIGAAQKVEHYEIAGYGTARAYAKLLGYDEIEDLLTDTIEEEAHADDRFSEIAEGTFFTTGLNKKALIQSR